MKNKTFHIKEFLPKGFYASENGQIASPAQSHIRSSKVKIIRIPFIGAFAFLTNQFQTKFELLNKIRLTAKRNEMFVPVQYFTDA